MEKNRKMGFVLPIYKDLYLLDAIPNIRKLYPEAQLIIVADDDKTMFASRQLGVFTPFHAKRIGFGKSLCEGVCLAWFTFKCDVVVMADLDHPFEAVKDFLSKIDEGYDVVVGKEKGVWKKSRIWANDLVQKYILNDVTHPTCGFQAWQGSLLEKIPWQNVKSKWDMIHPELLFWAKTEGARITECEFEEVQKPRIYVFRRYISWAISFARLFRLKYIWRRKK